jgi:hypothetical protein
MYAVYVGSLAGLAGSWLILSMYLYDGVFMPDAKTTEPKTPLSIRVPTAIHQKITALATDTGQSFTEVAVSLLGAALGVETAATPGDRLTALEKELESLQKKLAALATN